MMERFEHGGDVYTHKGVLDYSANLNPLGMPDSVKRVLAQSVDSFDVYPDPYCRDLTQAIAQFEDISASKVLPTAGATDAITRACLVVKPQSALVCAPCYSGYEQALEQVGAKIVRHNLREDEHFQVTNRILEDIDTGIDLIFLANPNNPTGALLDRDVLINVLDAALRSNAMVVLDECFIDLTPHTGSNDLLATYSKLIIVKAFTKTFALAGLRAGYALCSNPSFIAQMNDLGQTWAVSTPAQLAGIAALQEAGYIELAKNLIAAERERLVGALQNYGMQVVPGCANYIMFKCDKETVPVALHDAFLAQGILIRSCENFCGLDDSWFRIAVRAPEENTRFLVALQEVFA